MARTTLDIDPMVLEELRRRGRAEGRTMGELASELLERALGEGERRPEPRLRWSSRKMGSRVDLDDDDALYRALEGDG